MEDQVLRLGFNIYSLIFLYVLQVDVRTPEVIIYLFFTSLFTSLRTSLRKVIILLFSFP